MIAPTNVVSLAERRARRAIEQRDPIAERLAAIDAVIIRLGERAGIAVPAGPASPSGADGRPGEGGAA
jgi:hypothetical protein